MKAITALAFLETARRAGSSAADFSRNLNEVNRIIKTHRRLTMAPMPQIDHYTQRPVTAVQAEGDGWSVVLEGNVRIINTNPDYEQPDDSIVGTALNKVEFSTDMTKLWFGDGDNRLRTVMLLDPTTYQISDPNYNEGDPVSPQMADPVMTTAFESSAPGEREVDGPEENLPQDVEALGEVDH